MGGSAKTCQKYKKKLKVKYKKNIKHSTPPMQNIKLCSGAATEGPNQSDLDPVLKSTGFGHPGSNCSGHNSLLNSFLEKLLWCCTFGLRLLRS